MDTICDPGSPLFSVTMVGNGKSGLDNFRVALNLLIMKIRWSHSNKGSFHMKSFALSLTLVATFKATRKCSIDVSAGCVMFMYEVLFYKNTVDVFIEK